ncbi:uncharacterized protein [Notamacropus eugenii]|uniref:uncharacterized protein isoform X1 n=1 Tax=Notamacropus eugenii TaxID=9315 RepID=UPI003B6818E1
MAAKEIKEGKAQREHPMSFFYRSEPREENLLRDEGFHETARKDSLEREQGITKVLSSEEIHRSLEFFLFLLSSAASEYPTWKGSEDLYGRSLCDHSSPSELSAFLGCFPPFQSCEDSSDIPVPQISINKGETSRTTGCGRYIQNKETSGQGIIIKSPLPTLHKGSTISERELDMPLKDIKPSELATTEENFRENLEHMLQLEIQEMDLNIQQGTWRNMIWHHPKSAKERFWRNKIELEKPHEIQIKKGKAQRKDPVSLFHRFEPREENLSRDEGFYETAKKDSLERKQGITKVLSSEEIHRSLQFFLFLLSSAASEYPTWKDLYGRSFCDDSSPSELSASLGYVHPFQSCEDCSDIPVQQISISNGETSRTTGCGRYIQNKETSGQGIIIKSPLPTLHKGSTVSERELDMPLKDIKQSELATTEENFREKLEHVIELEIQEMSLNIQQGTSRNMSWRHTKSSMERFWRNKIELEKPHEIQWMLLPHLEDPRREPSCSCPSESQCTSFGNPPSWSSSFHHQLQWIQPTFSRGKGEPL